MLSRVSGSLLKNGDFAEAHSRNCGLQDGRHSGCVGATLGSVQRSAPLCIQCADLTCDPPPGASPCPAPSLRRPGICSISRPCHLLILGSFQPSLSIVTPLPLLLCVNFPIRSDCVHFLLRSFQWLLIAHGTRCAVLEEAWRPCVAWLLHTSWGGLLIVPDHPEPCKTGPCYTCPCPSLPLAPASSLSSVLVTRCPLHALCTCVSEHPPCVQSHCHFTFDPCEFTVLSRLELPCSKQSILRL